MSLFSCGRRQKERDGFSFSRTVRLPIAVHQGTLYVGSPVQNLAAHLNIGQYAVASVILQCPAAHFKQVRHLLVSQQLIAIYGRSALAEQLFERSQKPVEIRVEFTYPLMVYLLAELK